MKWCRGTLVLGKGGAHNLLKPEYYVWFRGEGYDDMSEYIKVEMRLGHCVDQIFTQVLGV